jgi:F-type H+-transporting ATPase subunit b
LKLSFSISAFPRTLSLALFMALAASPVLAPAHAVAQQAAPNATVKSSENSAVPAQAGSAKQEHEDADNVYRHTPLVRKLAEMFHLDVETTARLFEWINFAIIMLAIVIPIAKFLPKLLRKRTQTLAHNLETARKTTADANTRLSAVEAQLAHLDEEIAKIRAQVEDESKQDEARVKASLQEESARIFAAAEQEIAAAATHAQRELRHFAADLAIENAARQMVLTPEIDRALLAEFVSEATDGAARGGRS